jgi:hypothetical protein
MAISTNAFFFYGICWDQEDHLWPWETHTTGDPLDDAPGMEDWEDQHRGALAPFQVRIGEHCEQTCPMGLLALAETFTKAKRGYPKRILHTQQSSDAEERLKGACEVIGYRWEDVKDKVGWWLVSDTDAFG